MKNIVNIINDFFSDQAENIEIVERFEKFIIKGILKSNKPILEENEKCLLNYLIPKNDRWVLMIFLNDEDPLFETHNEISDDFKFHYKDVYPIEDDKLAFKLIIQKENNNGNYNIYSLKHFESWLNNLSSISFLKVINPIIKKNLFVNFIFLERSDITIISERVRVNDSIFKRQKLSNNWEYFHFDNNKDYPYRGNDFISIQKNTKDFPPLTSKLINLSNLFSITSLFDVTYIDNDELVFQLHGFKHLKGSVKIGTLDETYSLYTKINNWIYSTNSNISDKIGLARNIISLYKRDNSLEIDDNVYESILSGYKIYLKDNISKYIEIRTKLSDDINKILLETRESLNELSSNYQKSNFLYISFFMSVFILRMLNKNDFQNIFTKDATVMFLSLLAISFIYLIYSIWLVFSKRNRIEKRYELLKTKNTDLLTKTDISKILNNDSEFNDELKYTDIRIVVFIILWIVTMIVFYIAVSQLSNYI
ncbi:hypothetical protein [uncultured Kordia sp.]|uniref:hypothetical protein n=1 Tax=uncultured Kordia sp. TaxID=507699 RepID=UPI002624D787|nr:hypothetical protein [uncultured Kordia sp.]